VQQRTWIRWLSVMFILPWAVPSIPTILSVRFMFNPEWGMINHLIFHLFGDRRGRVAERSRARPDAGDHGPYLEVAAVLDADPDDRALRDRARICSRPPSVDGASWWQKFRFITWPSLQTLYVTCTLLSMIWTLGDFNSVYLFTGGGPAISPMCCRRSASAIMRNDQLDLDGLHRLRDAA
jgi:multiple sugar transport system permease protein